MSISSQSSSANVRKKRPETSIFGHSAWASDFFNDNKNARLANAISPVLSPVTDGERALAYRQDTWREWLIGFARPLREILWRWTCLWSWLQALFNVVNDLRLWPAMLRQIVNAVFMAWTLGGSAIGSRIASLQRTRVTWILKVLSLPGRYKYESVVELLWRHLYKKLTSLIKFIR